MCVLGTSLSTGNFSLSSFLTAELRHAPDNPRGEDIKVLVIQSIERVLAGASIPTTPEPSRLLSSEESLLCRIGHMVVAAAEASADTEIYQETHTGPH